MIILLMITAFVSAVFATLSKDMKFWYLSLGTNFVIFVLLVISAGWAGVGLYLLYSIIAIVCSFFAGILIVTLKE